MSAPHPPPTSPFDLDRLRSGTFVADVEFHPRLASTNDRALELCRQPRLATPWLVLTAEQTAGRGRGANRWWSASGALAFSLVVDAEQWNLPVDRRAQVSLAAALAVAQALTRWLPASAVRLKWPNDVWIDRRKACGILVEVPDPQGSRLVLGIGLNVNNSFDAAPPEVRAAAVSLRDALGRSLPLTDVLIELLDRLADEADRLSRDALDLAARWSPHCLLTGRTVELEAAGRRVRGTCRGIDDQGALLLETPTGLERCFGGTVARFE